MPSRRAFLASLPALALLPQIAPEPRGALVQVRVPQRYRSWYYSGEVALTPADMAERGRQIGEEVSRQIANAIDREYLVSVGRKPWLA